MTVKTSTNKRGATVKVRTKKDGTKVRTVTGKNGGVRKQVKAKDGSKTITRSKDGKVTGGKTTNAKGKVTSVTRTRKGETKTYGANSAKTSVANRIANGKGKNAKKMQDLKAKKKAARQSGDKDKLKALRKKSTSIRRTMTKNTRARRAAGSSDS
jgi:hypothetical protein